jgi:hypothetical protein
MTPQQLTQIAPSQLLIQLRTAQLLLVRLESPSLALLLQLLLQALLDCPGLGRLLQLQQQGWMKATG